MMEGFKRDCRLCDNVINDVNFQVIEDGIKNIFDRLLLNLTLDNDTQNVICVTCSTKLRAILNFKTTCVDTDDTLSPYINLENGKPLDLKEIYAKEKGYEQGGGLLDDEEVCRLCLRPTNSYHKSIQEVLVESIQICIPEIDFTVTTNPVICMKCHDALCVHSSFIKNCLEVEKKRNVAAMDVKNILLIDPCVKTEEIEIKPEPSDDEALFEISCDIKKEEEEEEGDSSFHSRNGSIGTVETKNPSEMQVYMCDKCDYKNIKKRNLLRHQLKHRDPSEKRVFECEECDYKSFQKEYFKIHQLKHKHPSEVPVYTCDKCDYKSINIRNLRSHQARHNVRLYSCDVCDYKNFRKSNFMNHQLKHKSPSEVQKYTCDKCDYKSLNKKYMRQHQLIHADPSEIKMYECDVCDYKSVHKGNLLSHKFRHENHPEMREFKCNECDYRSFWKGDLDRHHWTHIDSQEVQIYKSDKCDYKRIENKMAD